MRTYEKPVIKADLDLAEGVFLASGGSSSGDNSAICWTVTASSSQDWTGSDHTFRLNGVHSTAVQHISLGCTFSVSFNEAVTGAYTENSWPCAVSGNTVTITRPQHANAYNSGDNFNICVWVRAADEASTKALAVTGVNVIACDKTVNVQGGGADGN